MTVFLVVAELQSTVSDSCVLGSILFEGKLGMIPIPKCHFRWTDDKGKG